MPINFFQRVGDFFEQRKEYRQAALVALRKREGLPHPVDEQGNELETRLDDFGEAHYYNQAGQEVEHVYWAGTGKDGKPGAFAIGQRKGADLVEASRNWGDPHEAEFEILDVAEDGRRLEDELRDLDRDATTFERSARVSHGPEGEQAPGFAINGTSDEEIDQRLQAYVKRSSL